MKTEKVRFTHEITLSDNQVVSAELEAVWDWVDNGIGQYEYWGGKFRDVDYEWELFDITYLGEQHKDEINDYIDENLDKLRDISYDKLTSEYYDE